MELIESERYKKAIILAFRAHRGKRDEGGEFYSLHSLSVMLMLEDMGDKTVAVLHDVIKYNPSFTEEVKALLNDDELFADLMTITRHDGETYLDFIRRVKERGGRAVRVKIADITYNMDPSRHHRESEILNKEYAKALEILKGE